MRRAGLAVIAAGFLALAGGWGQPAPDTGPASARPVATPAADPKPKTTVTDLARAFLELEAAFFAAPVEKELCREVNIAFDDASKLFFAGDLARVVEIVKAQTARLFAAGQLDPDVLHGPREASALDGGATPRALDEAPINVDDLFSETRSDGLIARVQWPAQSEQVWRERRSLLSRAETPGSLESMLFNARFLRTELIAEYRNARDGMNPYTNHRGDIWRPYFIAEQPAPMRLFCPEHREPPAAGWPLVIALHGAGGNEHMFMAAYGAGRIKHLAETHNFIVVSPLNSPLAAQPMVFDALVESIALDYPIDRTRVHLIGHSMGAGVALAWSKMRHEQVAASALIAGVGRFNPKDTVPPTLLIAPELDGLIPAKSILAAAAQAQAAGLPVECREIRDYGHTLVVGHVLPEVVDWLLRQNPAAKPAGTAPESSKKEPKP